MKIAIISYYKSDFKEVVKELVEEQGFAVDEEQFVWIKHEKDINPGVRFDHVVVAPNAESIYSWDDLEKLKARIPMRNEKFSDDE